MKLMASASAVTSAPQPQHSRKLWLIGSEMIVIGTTLGITIYSMLQMLKLQERVDAIEFREMRSKSNDVTRGSGGRSSTVDFARRIGKKREKENEEEEEEEDEDVQLEQNAGNGITQLYGAGSGILDDVVDCNAKPTEDADIVSSLNDAISSDENDEEPPQIST